LKQITDSNRSTKGGNDDRLQNANASHPSDVFYCPGDRENVISLETTEFTAQLRMSVALSLQAPPFTGLNKTSIKGMLPAFALQHGELSLVKRFAAQDPSSGPCNKRP
jgi:hypothetical protein